MGHPSFPLRLLALLLFSGLLLACGGSRRTVTAAGTDPLRKRSAAYLREQLAARNLAPEWLSGRARVTVRSPREGTQKFNMNIRLRRDSVIWMNVKKVSVEAGRVLITPDSLYFINRLDNQYAITSLAYARERFGLPGNFADLQDLLLGNPVFLVDKLSAKVAGDRYRLSGEDRRYETEYELDAAYRLRRFVNQEPALSRQLRAELDDYRPAQPGAPDFSHLRQFTGYSPDSDRVELEMEWSKLEWNVPKSLPFRIPPRYERLAL